MKKVSSERPMAGDAPPGKKSSDPQKKAGGSGQSRRLFLKGASLLATSVAALPAALAGCANAEAQTPPATPMPQGGPKSLGRGARKFNLRVNGADREVSAEPRATLLDVLREQLQVTGPKEICDRGACGGCSVLLDGTAVCGCMTLALDVEGREIQTSEGIGADPAAAKMVDSLCAHDAAQCGFCIPGFVVRGREILAKNPSASLAEIQDGLSGNICRCGTYSKLFDGFVAAAGGEVARRAENDVAIENELPRVDIRQKVIGTAKYAADIYPPKTMHLGMVRFPYGAGKMTEHNLKAARKTPGVIEAVMSGDDEGKYAGARLGYVLAESRDAMEDAIEALEMAFERGEARADAWKFYDGPPEPDQESQQQLKELFSASKAVAEATYSTQVQTHSCLEPHCFLVDHKGDRAEVWASTQGVFSVLSEIAKSCELDKSKISVLSEYVGGGFGSKFGAGPEGSLAASLSRKHGRPCRIYPDRKAEHLDMGNRPGSIQYMKIGADESGKLTGGRIHCEGVVGFQNGQGNVTNPFAYDFGRVEKTQAEITLNAGLPRAFRAPGHPQGVFAVESMMDELANKLGMDPLEFRRINETNDRRREQAKLGAQLAGWDKRQPDGSSPGRLKRGIGMAAGHWHFWPTKCAARATIRRDGKVEVVSGVQDIGTGTFTVVADAAADALGIDRKWIQAGVGKSEYPEGPGSGGSVVTRSVVPAVLDAVAQAKAELVEALAGEWGVEASEVTIGGDEVRGPGGKRLAWKDACALMRSATISAQGTIKKEYLGDGDTSATQFAEVEVDTETGHVRVVKIVAVQACGKIINRLTAENQVCGGVIQGISYALFEDRILDPRDGAMLNPNLEWYKIAGPKEIPEIIPVLDADEKDTGARALGEPCTIPTAGAIANAVANAIGARVRSLPITPERVLAALAEKKKEGGAA